MIKINKKNTTILYSIIFVLLILYIFSVTFFSNNAKNKKAYTKYTLIDEKLLSEINLITIQKNTSEQLVFFFKDNMWLITYNNDLQSGIPVDINTLKNFFVYFFKIQNIYKVSDNYNENNAYGLTQNNQTKINFYTNNSEDYEFCFGNLDFSQSKRYFSTNSKKGVYLINSDFDSFLTTSSQFWADPLIISTQIKDSVLQMGEIQSISIKNYEDNSSNYINSSSENWSENSAKLLELRHGGQNTDQNYLQQKKLYNLDLEMGDKSSINMQIFETSEENQFICKITFNSNKLKSEFSYDVKISLWTYNKIKEITL